MSTETERAQGFELDLRAGDTLVCTYVPNRKHPYLGILRGSTFFALAQFISGKEMDFLRDVMSKRIFVIQPMELAPDEDDRLD